ncbi:MAG: helix-turn-helix transcriptional regulator [Ezakiella sp.]|nr:helix-turn-helix domain-containing protein [Ezakiella sp.]MDY3947303.1 helix-turn-helix transcriptional regulator [Ezakiella sp.]
MAFGNKIKRLREQKGWTQAELASLIDKSLRTISAYENENIRPRKRETYDKLSELFGVNVNYLLTDEDGFLFTSNEVLAPHDALEANKAIAGVLGLFAGGDISLEDKKTILDAITEAYYDAKAKEAREGRGGHR